MKKYHISVLVHKKYEVHAGSDYSMRQLLDELKQYNISYTLIGTKIRIRQKFLFIFNIIKAAIQSDLLLFNGAGPVFNQSPKLVVRICRFFNCPVGVYVRESEYQYIEQYRIEERNKISKRLNYLYTFKQSQVYFLFVTNYSLEIFKKYFGNPLHASIVLNGIKVSEYDKHIQNKSLNSINSVIINLGSLQARKNYLFFIYVAKKVIEYIPEAMFIWCGEGEDLNYARSKANELNCSSNVLFTGHLNNISLLYLLSSIIFIPSITESFSRVACEALFWGKPIVYCEGVGGPEEIIGNLGYSVENNNVDEAAKIIIQLLSDSSFHSDEKSTKEKKLFNELYDISIHAYRVYNVIDQISKKHKLK